MWIENEIYYEDLKNNINNIEWNLLRNKTVFVTGGTGMIGSSLINTILYANKTLNLNCRVISLVRNIERAKELFKQQLCEDLHLELLEGDVCERIQCKDKVDYVVHAASQTASKKFIDESIATINTSLMGTKNTLELAAKNNIKKFIFLSTMEVYGTPQSDEKINEDHDINLDTMDVRNCYPISKIMCENLCSCYAKQYNFDINILRLTQTFGSGVSYYDTRVFAEFARCVIEDRNIILHTKGETKRSYLYVSDAVTAIIYAMVKGRQRQIYNVANEQTYCSILEMAKLVANKNKNIKVEIELDKNEKEYGYAKTLCMNLDTSKIRQLGWQPRVDLDEMYDRLINFMKSIKNV